MSCYDREESAFTMSSDDGAKSSTSRGLWTRLCKVLKHSFCWRMLIRTLGVIGLLMLIGYWFRNDLPPPELVHSQTFSAEDNVPRVPLQCREKVRHFYQCQNNYTQTHVVACHRRWCHSFGHCEPCAGIGDRTRFLLSQIYDDISPSEKCTRVQLDYPALGLAILDSAVYLDPGGWLAELFHYRSYSVQDRLPPQKAPVSPNGFRFTHFQPDGYVLADYDPCHFYALFRPDPFLQAELDQHNRAISSPSIGIHYRTGDVAAFGIWRFGGDNRVSHVQEGWDRMLACADGLAARNFPNQKVTYYVATDNRDIKDMLLRQPQQGGRTLYTTAIRPGSYLRGLTGDRGALMEVLLLAARQGLVVNVRQRNYHGPAGMLSYFALLAKNLGFFSDHEVLECSIETQKQ